MKNTRVIIGFILFAISAAVTSCKKDQVTSEIDNEGISNEAIASFVEKSISIDEDTPALRSGTGSQGNCNWQNVLPECALVTESGDEYPRTVSIDYGDGCTDGNGVTKSGVITIHLSNDMMLQGSVRTVTFENFMINNTQIEGSRVTTNTGMNELGQPVFDRIINTTITRNAHIIERVSNEQLTWLSGYDTDECGDNIISVTGSGTCTRQNGLSRTRNIILPLIIDHNCGYITEGIIEISGPQGTGTINFGDGTCDDIAIATRPNGSTHEIHLHQP